MFKKKFPSLSSLGADGNTAFLRAARAGNLDKVLEYLKSNIDINTSNANGLNALHLASKDGHVNVVTELLKRGATVDAATKKGNTALHIASLAGQEEVVKILVQNGASVNVQSQNGFTPLYMAAQENHDNVVRFLLANGANQSLATEDGFTPLAVAMQQGHDKVVTVLLENDTRGKVRLPALHIAAKKDDCKAAALLLQNDHNPDVTSKSGFTPLHIAAHYGNENIANLLLQRGADVNYSAKHNITPLHVAAKWGKTNMVSLLIEKGANIEAKTRDGLTPLHCAARSGHEQVVDMLLERGAPISSKTKNGLAPLHMASQGDHVDAARILLYHRAPVDEVTVDYLTALHVAAHCGHVRVAKLLLDRKADPNARALNGFTPLHIACKKNRIKVVELLLKHGASIEATTESGLTPLHVASFMGCMNIVIYLIQHEANPDVPTVRGETPLHLAARANQADIIRILLRNGAQVDARAREQQTPLHIASRLGNVDIVMLLLQHGAAVDATTKDMYTALHIAAKEGQEEVASVLLEHGASLTATTKKGFTPLHLAAKYGKMKVARLLLQRDAPVDAQGKNGVTPLHVASHYDHQNVALLLLDKGASPHATAKNGHTPLHIAARKNQMDIATTLLEYGAKANAESKAGFTPLHLSSQEGHTDMSTLLIEHQADPNHKAKNGLTPLHLCAQEDRVNVATILVKNGAEVDAKTKAGYTPLHVACHFGQINMVRFLLQHGVDVNSATSAGYTPLHQAAQQGHVLIINLLLESRASPNAVTNQGQTALSIAQKLGYISVVETLKVVTETVITTTTTITTEEKYRVMAPETMQETFMSDSEDEGGEDTMLSDQPYRYLTVDEMKSLGDDSLPIDVTRDERGDSNRDSMAPPTAMEDSISPQHTKEHYSQFSTSYAPDNVDIARHPVHVGKLQWKTFLVSFMVDARGGAMRGCRHSGVRVIVPPRKAAMPMRITCRYLKKDKLAHPPPLMEGEALASRILELGPVAAKFLGPVIIEVPHFGSLRGKEREIVILRSDNGETWREHTLEASEEAIQDVLNESFDGEELTQLEDLNTNRITRILTTDFPQYFAIVSRVRQEVHAIGPEGGMVSSTVVPQVQAVFPQGALTKKIKVGLQAQPISAELVAKLLGNRVAVSPIVTVEPRRRKFHKPITLTIPVPQAANKGMINQYSGDAPTLRLLCSITGGTTRAQWEDVTGSTPLTFVNDCVSFTTTVSARFWLMDCRNIVEATKMATELYKEAIHVPFMAKFVVFAKRVDVLEARLRLFCMTDDKEDKTLEHQEHFTEVAKSRDVEVLEGKSQFVEFAGNLIPVTKSGDQLQLGFHAFKENRLPFTVRVKDPHADTVGRILFMREPKVAKGEPPQSPICILNIVLPETITPEMAPSEPDLLELEKKYSFLRDGSLSRTENIHKADLRLSDICNLLGLDWIQLANELGIAQDDIHLITSEYPDSVPQQAMVMLRLWMQQSGNKATGNTLEKSLRRINREDIVDRCIFNVELVTDDMEKAVAKVRLDQSGFDNLKEELGPSRDTSLRRNVSLDVTYDEQDIMKESESVEELVAAEKIVTPKEDRLTRESEVEAKDIEREKDIGAEKIGDEVRKSIKDYEREEQKYVGEEKEYKEFEEALMKDSPKPVKHEEIPKKRSPEEVKEAAFVKDESKKSPTIMAGMAEESGDEKKRKADMIAEITEELGRLDTSYKGGAPMPVKEAVTSPKISKTPPPSPAEFKEGTVLSTKVTHEFPARDTVVGEEHTEYITPDGTTVRQTTITKTTILQGAEPSITEEAAQLAESETWQSDDLSTHPEELSSVQVTPQDDSTVAESLESDGFKEHFPMETPPVERHPFEAGSESEDTPEVELVSLRMAQLHNLFTYQKPTSKRMPEDEPQRQETDERVTYTSPEEKGSKDSKRSEYEKGNLNARPQRRKDAEPIGTDAPPLTLTRLTGGITPDGEEPSDGEPGRGGVGGSDQPDDGGGELPPPPPDQPEEGPTPGGRGDSDRVDRGTSPLDETTSPVSVQGGGRREPPSPHAESPLVERAPAPSPRAPTLELVIGRKEVHTRDASASSESRLTLYGAQEFVRGFEISIRSQSHISVTTTTKESGKETSQRVDVGLTTSAGTGRRSAFPVPTPPEEMGVERGDVVEEDERSRGADEVTSAEGREYVVKHPDEDGGSFGGRESDIREKFETEVKEKKKETLGGGETVIFSGEKSIYHYESQEVGGYSPFESPTTESAAHITDTGIGMTRTDTATTDTDTVTSPVHRPPISDTAVDTEAELTDAGFSPIQTEVAVPGLDFFRDNVTYSDAAISPVYAPGVTVALSPLQVETSEAGVLTDAIETRDAGISPVKLSLSESTSPISIEGPTAQTQIPERMDVASSPITKEMLEEKPKSIASIQSVITPYTSVQTATLSTFHIKTIPSSQEKSLIRDRPAHVQQIISSRPKEVEEIVERRRRDSGDVKTMVRMLEEGSLPRPPEDTPPEKIVAEVDFTSTDIRLVRETGRIDSAPMTITSSIDTEKFKPEEKLKYYETEVAVQIEPKKKKSAGISLSDSPSKAIITHTKNVGPKIKQLQRFFTQESETEKLIEKEVKSQKLIPTKDVTEEEKELFITTKIPPKAKEEEVSPIDEEKEEKPVDKRDAEISKLIQSMELTLEPPEKWSREKASRMQKRVIVHDKKAKETALLEKEPQKVQEEYISEKGDEKEISLSKTKDQTIERTISKEIKPIKSKGILSLEIEEKREDEEKKIVKAVELRRISTDTTETTAKKLFPAIERAWDISDTKDRLQREAIMYATTDESEIQSTEEDTRAELKQRDILKSTEEEKPISVVELKKSYQQKIDEEVYSRKKKEIKTIIKHKETPYGKKEISRVTSKYEKKIKEMQIGISKEETPLHEEIQKRESHALVTTKDKHEELISDKEPITKIKIDHRSEVKVEKYVSQGKEVIEKPETVERAPSPEKDVGEAETIAKVSEVSVVETVEKAVVVTEGVVPEAVERREIEEVVEEVLVAEKVVEAITEAVEISEVKVPVGPTEVIKEVAEEVVAKEVGEVSPKEAVSPVAEEEEPKEKEPIPAPSVDEGLPSVEEKEGKPEVPAEEKEVVVEEVHKDVSPAAAEEDVVDKFREEVETVSEEAKAVPSVELAAGEVAEEEVTRVEEEKVVDEDIAKISERVEETREVVVSEVVEEEVVRKKVVEVSEAVTESVEIITEVKETKAPTEVVREVVEEIVTKEVVEVTAKEPVPPAPDELAVEKPKEEVPAPPTPEREGEPKPPSEELVEPEEAPPAVTAVEKEGVEEELPAKEIPSAAEEVTEVVEELREEVEAVKEEVKAPSPVSVERLEEVSPKEEAAPAEVPPEILDAEREKVPEEVVEVTPARVEERAPSPEKDVGEAETIAKVSEVSVVETVEKAVVVTEGVVPEAVERREIEEVVEEVLVAEKVVEAITEAVEISEVKVPVGPTEVITEVAEEVLEKAVVDISLEAVLPVGVSDDTLHSLVGPISSGVHISSFSEAEITSECLGTEILESSDVVGESRLDESGVSHTDDSTVVSRSQQLSNISVEPCDDLKSRPYLQSVPSISDVVDPCSRISTLEIDIRRELSSADVIPSCSAFFSELPGKASPQHSVVLESVSDTGLSDVAVSSVPEEMYSFEESGVVDRKTLAIREIREGSYKLPDPHQTVIPESTVGTLSVPISEDGESQSDIVGSQASVSTFSDVSEEPRRPFLSKSRREQLSILTKRVLSEKEMKELMIEVKEVTRQIKQEVKELKPDLTPTPEGIPFPSQAFIDDSETSLASIIEEHSATSEASRKAPLAIEKSFISTSHDVSGITLPKTSFADAQEFPRTAPETVYEKIVPVSDTYSKPGKSLDEIDKKDVKVVTIFEEEVVLDNVMETVVDEIQTVEKLVTDDSTKSHEYESVGSTVFQKSLHDETKDGKDSCSTMDVCRKSEIGELVLPPKIPDTASLSSDTATLPMDLRSLADIETAIIPHEKGHIERTPDKQDIVEPLDSMSGRVDVPRRSREVEQTDEHHEHAAESSSLPFITSFKEDLKLREADVAGTEGHFPSGEETSEGKSPQEHMVCPYSGDSHHYRPILDVTSDDIVLKDDDTIEITVSEDPSQIYSTTSTHATVETTMHTSSSGATFVEVMRDGQRSICVCEKIVQSQTLVPKESTSRVKHPPETPTTSKTPSTSGISKARTKETYSEPLTERKRSTPSIKAPTESHDTARKRPALSKPSAGPSDSEGVTAKKKVSSKSYQSSYVPPTSDSYRKVFSSTHTTHPQMDEALPRERPQKKRHYADDTASSSSKKVTVTHRREESQYSRSYRSTRDTSDTSDKSPAFRKSSGRREGDLDQSHVPKKLLQEGEKKTPGKDDPSKDRLTSSKKLTLPSVPGPSHVGHTEPRETTASRKTTPGKGAQGKIPRSSIPTKKKETTKESEVPILTDTQSTTVAASASVTRHSTSTVTQRISSTRISERTTGTTIKQTRKTSSLSKVPKPTKSSLEIQTSTSAHQIPPAAIESQGPVTPKLPAEDVRTEVFPSQIGPKLVDSSPESSVTVMTSTPSPSLCQPSFGIPDSSSPTPSLPSSPSRMRHSSAASGSITQLMTSEVFTRTLDVTGAIEVIYRQPTTSESLRRIAPSKSSQLSAESTTTPSGALLSSQLDSSQIDTTDSSLSDSIALPSSSSDLDFSGAQDGYRQVLSRSGTFAPQRTSHPPTPSHLSPSPSSLIVSQTAHRRTARTTQVSEERLSPILDVRAVTPPRVKHKFEYVAGDEVEEAGEHPQGKRLAPHHSARCHQLFSTSASVQSMASDLEQIISNVRKAFWPSQFSSEQTDKLLSVLQNRAQSLSKLAVDFPRQFDLVEGKLERGRHGHEIQTVNNDPLLNVNENSGALKDPPSRYVAKVPDNEISNNYHHITQQHSNSGGTKEQRRGYPLQNSEFQKDCSYGTYLTSSAELFSGDVDSHFSQGIHSDKSIFGGEGVEGTDLFKENIEYFSSSESGSDYALIEPSNNLKSFDYTSTDDEQDLIPIDLADTDSLSIQKRSNNSELNSLRSNITSQDSLETRYTRGTAFSTGDLCEESVTGAMETHCSGTAMPLKESSVPRIAIISDDDTLDRDVDDMLENAVNTIDTHTDIEDLEDEFDEMNVSKSKRKLSISLKTGDDGALTDVEDMEASGDEDEETQIDMTSPQIAAAFENILDAEGTYEELFKYDSLSNSGKTVVSTGQPSFHGLGIPEDSKTTGMVTDVEDFSGSEDENVAKAYIKEVDIEFLTELLENMGTVDISDTLKKQSQINSPGHTPSPGVSPLHGQMSPENKEHAATYEAHGRISPRSGHRSPTHRFGLSPTSPVSMRRFSDLTDTEILDSDSDEEKTKAAVLSRTRRHPPKGKASLRPPNLKKGSATDVEDVEFTDDECLAAKRNLDKHGTSKKVLMQRVDKKGTGLTSKHKDNSHTSIRSKSLGIPDDQDEGHTDVEDVEASGTEEDVVMEHYHYLKDPPENVFSIEEMESMYGSVMESQTTLDASSGQSVSLENQLTDTEELAESSPIKFQRNRDLDDQSSISSECSTEEGSFQGSDSEARSVRKAWRDGKVTSQLPVTEVKFFDRPDGSDPVPVILSPETSKESKKYIPKLKKSPLLLPKAVDGGVTDVEELISSGESDPDEYGAGQMEEEAGNKVQQQNSDDAITDLEDFEADNLDEIYFSHKLPSDLNPEDIPGFPPPVRELTLVKQDEHGHPTVLVLPLDEVKARGLFNPEESGAIPTDVEDLEDSEDEGEDQESSLRIIDAEGNKTLLVTPDLPPIEGGIIECTDTMKVERKKLKASSQAVMDPITDTEEMFLDTSPVQRKRKVRSRPQSSHKKPPLPTSPIMVTATAAAASTTDVEELEVSDVDSLPPGVRITQFSIKAVPLNTENTTNISDVKTDIEDIEASDTDDHNDIPSDRDACPTPDLMCEYGLATISEKQGDGPFSDDIRSSVIVQHTQMRMSDPKHQSQKRGSLGALPTIRMTSPSPDIPTTTDTEELFASADEGRESPTPLPAEIPFELEEHCSVVHVKHTSKIDVDAPGEAKYLKDHKVLDAHTDIEDLGLSEEEGQHHDINVDYATEASEDLGKLQESVLSQISVYDGKEKVCVCMGQRNKDSSISQSTICVCIGKPDGDLTIVPETLALSETATTQHHENLQGAAPADGASEEWAEKMQQKHIAGHGGLTAEDAGSEFYQTQDPESTSEYDPSQTTTQARVVTTRTLTRTVMGEDGRPVTVTTTETEVADGSGAEGVLDSNQLRESMQQIIDQFAAGEETKEGKESKKEKKPE